MYHDQNRGRVIFPDRMHQHINFNNIRLGNIVPCDIDLLYEVSRKFFTEYHNLAWIATEFKFADKNFPCGQQLMHERLINDLARSGKPAISILAEHNVSDPSQEVDAAECIVRQYYWKGKWHDCKGMKLKNAISNFIAKVDSKK